MPQWDFLNFLSEKAKQFSTFELRMQCQAVDLLRDGGRTLGVRAKGPDGNEVDVRADLVVGCDGRHSTIRKAAALELLEFGVPIDVLWFRISRRPGDPEHVFGNVNYGRALVLINRGDYFQAGLIIPKGSFEKMTAVGIAAFQQSTRRIAPFLGERTGELKDWEQVKLLTVQINRLRRWYRRGLLCIGDAAHAMSPAGGVGINLAIQDAVAAANLLTEPLLNKRLTEGDLAAVQQRREFPTRVTQTFQVNAHNGLAKIFRNTGPLKAPWQLKMFVRIPGLQRAMGYAVGIGVRPEHIRVARRKSAGIVAGAAIGSVVGAIVCWRRRHLTG
jgi:2-polyprenyl-6-methoxyphenol hydroxylase-like FAD-dependent oxidoreductase